MNKDGDRIWSQTNFAHTQCIGNISDRYPAYDIFSLELSYVKDRVSETVLDDGRRCFFKIAQFPHELQFLIQELKAYHFLEDHQSNLAPKLIGYVYEEAPDRVIGFLVEAVEGRVAGVEDLEVCKEVLDEMHQILIHGDLCRYNILISYG